MVVVLAGAFTQAPTPAGGPQGTEVAEQGECDLFEEHLIPGPVTPELYDLLQQAVEQEDPPAGLQEAAASAVTTGVTDPLIEYCRGS